MATSKKIQSIEKKEAKWGILLAMPAILGFILWTVGPMIASLYISFTDWGIANTPKFFGLSNYFGLLKDDLFWKSLKVTLYYTIGSVPLGIIVAFLLAILLNQEVRGKAIFRTIFYLPSIVPGVASSMLWLWLFNPDFGLFNALLNALGLPKLQWIYDDKTVIPSLIIMSVWGIGGTMIIFLAGLQGIPQHLYEAVEIDGGNWFHKFVYITVPMMTPTIFFNLIMGLIGSFQVFTQAYIMTNGGPNNASLFYVLYLFRKAFTDSQMGYASSMAWILFIIIAVLTALVFKSSASWVYYEEGNR